MENQNFVTKNSEETKALAKKLALHLRRGDVIGLRGELGSGKTTFVQGLSEGLHILEGYRALSPTFTLINEYPCHSISLFHMDFYRLEKEAEVETLGFDSYFGVGVCVIEWFEKAPQVLPLDFLEIQFQWISESVREICFVSHGDRSQNSPSL